MFLRNVVVTFPGSIEHRGLIWAEAYRSVEALPLVLLENGEKRVTICYHRAAEELPGPQLLNGL